MLDALLFTPARNGKLRLMREYFAMTPERGWALAALTSELGFPEAKPRQVRDLAMARVDPELSGWSWDFVGDLTETVALIWPEQPQPEDPHPPPACAGGSPLPRCEKEREAAPFTLPCMEKGSVPTLIEIIETLRNASRAEIGDHLARWLDRLDATGRWRC